VECLLILSNSLLSGITAVGVCHLTVNPVLGCTNKRAGKLVKMGLFSMLSSKSGILSISLMAVYVVS
jgi:hypothetical protein